MTNNKPTASAGEVIDAFEEDSNCVSAGKMGPTVVIRYDSFDALLGLNHVVSSGGWVVIGVHFEDQRIHLAPIDEVRR